MKKTLLQRAPTKFAMYEVPQSDQFWPALKPKEAWLAATSQPEERKRRHGHCPVPRAFVAKEERCGRCSRQEMWAAYDVFRSMDKSGENKISRHDYLETMSNYPTLDKLKVLRKCDLEARFRANAQEVQLEEFLLRMWPQANAEDMKKMLHWAKMRDAQELVRAGNYTGKKEKLQQIFDLLDKDHNHLLDGNELKSILKKSEIEQMINETACHRAQFTAADRMATEKGKGGLRSEFKRLLNRGRTSSSAAVEQLIENENSLKNKLTFDEFCHLLQPRQKAGLQK